MIDNPKIKSLLFDLDGTLIELDMSVFLPRYFKALGEHLADLMKPEALITAILNSTEAMINNLDPKMSNKDVFEQDFFKRTGLSPQIAFPLFDSFYEQVFPQLAGTEVRNLAAQRAIELALARGFEVVIATNPVFPQKAIFERLRWGGFANKKFNLITSYENMHFCKPKPQYYAEILSKLGRTPAECWMIGNDVEEDLVAAQLGIKTFLVQDYLIPGSKKITPTKKGYMADLPDFVNSLNREGIPSGGVE